MLHGKGVRWLIYLFMAGWSIRVDCLFVLLLFFYFVFRCCRFCLFVFSINLPVAMSFVSHVSCESVNFLHLWRQWLVQAF